MTEMRQPRNPNEMRVFWAYAGIVFALTWFCFGDLRHHLLDTHDAESFADHLLIAQDWQHFFSSTKEQATGRLLADAVKYLAFLAFGNSPAAFHLLVVALLAMASLLPVSSTTATLLTCYSR